MSSHAEPVAALEKLRALTQDRDRQGAEMAEVLSQANARIEAAERELDSALLKAVEEHGFDVVTSPKYLALAEILFNPMSPRSAPELLSEMLRDKGILFASSACAVTFPPPHSETLDIVARHLDMRFRVQEKGGQHASSAVVFHANKKASQYSPSGVWLGRILVWKLPEGDGFEFSGADHLPSFISPTLREGLEALKAKWDEVD